MERGNIQSGDFECELKDLSSRMRRRSQWFGHVKRDMKDGGCVGSVQEMNIPGRRPCGRPKKSWKKVVDENLEEFGIDEISYDRKSRKNVTGAGQTPSQGKKTLKEMMMINALHILQMQKNEGGDTLDATKYI